MPTVKTVYKIVDGKVCKVLSSHLATELAEDAQQFKSDWLEPRGMKGKAIPQWPIHSEAAAVDPEDIPYATEFLKKRGVNTEFDKIGCPIFTSQAHRKKHCEAVGLYDRNAGYGDPQPKNR